MKAPANWKELKRHPISARYEDWPSDLRESVTAKLKADGWKNKKSVVTIHENMVLDGWQRLQCAIAADVEPPFESLPNGLDAEEFVAQVNDDRRHEDMDTIIARAKARRERVVAARQAGDSIRTIADAEGVSKTTIENDIESVTAQGGQCDPPDGKVLGQDGREQPARKGTSSKSKGPKPGSPVNQSAWDDDSFNKLYRCVDKLYGPYNLQNSFKADQLRLKFKELKMEFEMHARELKQSKTAS